jgi:ketosteroid isomerase-like protein
MRASRPVVLAITLLAAPPALSETSDEVAASVHAFYKALRDGDVSVLAASLPESGFTEFNTDSSELQTYSLQVLRKAFTGGVKIDFHIEHLKVDVHGDTAIATGYRVGSLSFPDGRHVESYNCESIVLTHEQSRWLVRHVHLSQCAPVTARP